MEKLTPLEKEALEVSHAVLDALAVGKVPRRNYLEMMAGLVELNRKLLNKSYGCKTGKHSGPCVC